MGCPMLEKFLITLYFVVPANHNIFQFGIVTHEIGHALGFYHTQSRYDRDDYVDIEFSNISPDMQYNFAKRTPLTEYHFGQKYDYGSVMQYNACSFPGC
ncbi:astacin [Ancylostoma ceylanicum]|uniref:Metalloendopeptidase n=1 Tax=Ancylostoma ceylanicum TaxID=53326 RepID=A0A0D6LQX1_9BILA|nr:astacin [Ancylostoma ceylanicum]